MAYPIWQFRTPHRAAYQIDSKTVVRSGFGLFYDLGDGSAGMASTGFPYERDTFISPPTPLPFDLSNPAFQPSPFSTTIGKGVINITAVDPNLRLPVTLEWNAAIERQLGTNQTFTATYLGSDGRRLLREDVIFPPLLVSLGSGGSVNAVRNAGTSHYNALQIQFQRRLSHGLQALMSYNLAKSTDMGSSDADGLAAGSIRDIVLPPLTPSDFDIRNSIAGAVSYEIPVPSSGRAARAILRGWAVDGLVRVSSAPPINVTVPGVLAVTGQYQNQADVVPGQPFWIPDPTQPSGRALNPAAFAVPAAGQMGNFPRNGLRSPYSINQTDLAVRRQFNLTERVKLDVRAEYFNVFNHPMFGLPGSQCAPDPILVNESGPNPSFGKVCPGTSTTNVDDGAGLFGQSSLYAVGGPRSGQLTIKLLF